MKAQFYPFLQVFSVLVQLIGMILLIFDKKELKIFLISVAIIAFSIIVYALLRALGKVSKEVFYPSDEISFNEKYPPLKILDQNNLKNNLDKIKVKTKYNNLKIQNQKSFNYLKNRK